MSDHVGGCLCGAVRYRLAAEPYDTGWCHCRVCQKASGAPALVFSTVALDDYQIERGAEHVGSVRSTDVGERRFCRLCGTPLTIHVDFQPDEIYFTVATLDVPDAVQPGFHIFYDSRIGWAEAGDDLPRHARYRSGTRGLD